jgi:hypothetical protein
MGYGFSSLVPFRKSVISSIPVTVADEIMPVVQVAGLVSPTITYGPWSFAVVQAQFALVGSVLSTVQGLSRHHAHGRSFVQTAY